MANWKFVAAGYFICDGGLVTCDCATTAIFPRRLRIAEAVRNAAGDQWLHIAAHQSATGHHK